MSGIPDEVFMRRALTLAAAGWGQVHPNPMVGAVVVRDDRVVGSGAHRRFGEMHAETQALVEAGTEARGATLYVTLEPCCHVGKQPACVPAILDAGIARVVIAHRDPNPVATGGAEALRAAGLDVVVGVAEEAARQLNFRFLRLHAKGHRPFVAVKLAVSLDGFLADHRGASQWLTGDAARHWVHRERAGYAAIAVGGATAVADDVRLTVRGSVTPRVAPIRVIFDRSGRLGTGHGILADGSGVPVTVVSGIPRPELAALPGVSVLVTGDLEEALELLYRSGVDAMLVEGGGRLAGALLRLGLLDRVYQLQAPTWLGAGQPAWAGLPAFDLASAPHWRTIGRTRLGQDTLLVLER